MRSIEHGETFHPVIGPVAEAEALYVKQLELAKRAREGRGEMVIWDVGLGAAANPVTVARALTGWEGKLRILSFDNTTGPLEFALENTEELRYLRGFEGWLERLLQEKNVQFKLPDGPAVEWEMRLADFPTILNSSEAESWPKPDGILFDAFSPARNAVMWTYPVFARLHALLDPARPCAMPTYSRSTMLRVTLLLAGFYVGAGHATGEKEETTIAANTLGLLREPLGLAWLKRARNSTSAEPMWEPSYRQAPLSEESWDRLRRHPQFQRKS